MPSVPGLGTFCERYCDTLDAATGKRLDGYISIRAGKDVSSARQVDERITDASDQIYTIDAADIALLISGIIDTHDTKYAVFTVHFYETASTNPLFSMRPPYYSRRYQPPPAGSQLAVQNEDKVRPSGAAEMGLTQITLASMEHLQALRGELREANIALIAAVRENTELQYQTQFYQLIAGVQKWSEVKTIVSEILKTGGPIISENTKGFISLASQFMALKMKQADNANAASNAGKEAQTDDEKIDAAILVLVDGIIGHPERCTLPRGMLLKPVADAFEAALDPEGYAARKAKEGAS